MKTTEGNVLINEFMGWCTQLHLCEHPQTGEYVDHDELKYHTSWDWLMEVVEKIDEILLDDQFVTITYNSCTIDIYSLPLFVFDFLTIEGLGNSRIEATWNAVCEFIQWYNENKEETK